jgi:hypothetical protein
VASCVARSRRHRAYRLLVHLRAGLGGQCAAARGRLEPGEADPQECRLQFYPAATEYPGFTQRELPLIALEPA